MFPCKPLHDTLYGSWGDAISFSQWSLASAGKVYGSNFPYNILSQFGRSAPFSSCHTFWMQPRRVVIPTAKTFGMHSASISVSCWHAIPMLACAIRVSSWDLFRVLPRPMLVAAYHHAISSLVRLVVLVGPIAKMKWINALPITAHKVANHWARIKGSSSNKVSTDMRPMESASDPEQSISSACWSPLPNPAIALTPSVHLTPKASLILFGEGRYNFNSFHTSLSRWLVGASKALETACVCRYFRTSVRV